jgi:hypothetical protein
MSHHSLFMLRSQFIDRRASWEEEARPKKNKNEMRISYYSGKICATFCDNRSYASLVCLLRGIDNPRREQMNYARAK